MLVGESIGVAALGWVASPVVKMLLDEGYASLGINADKKLLKLRDTVLPVLKSVIEKAEGSPHRSEVEGWLQRLKDAYDDVEDALDLLNYDRLKRKAANRVRSPPHTPKPVKLKGVRDMLSLQKTKLKRRLNKLEKIAGEAEKLSTLLGGQPGQTAAAPEELTAAPPQKVFGRDKDREEIIRLLKMEPAAIREPRSPPAGIPIIAIVGRPGVGKTTLAQYVSEQLRSEFGNRHFHPILWVNASYNFKASEIMRSIIEQDSVISGRQDCGNLGTIHSPEAIRLKMKIQLRVKKFLLVIDDVWCDRDDQKKNWDTLVRCLSECSRGSKILVTSQTRHAPRMIGATTENIYCLEELDDAFSDLFMCRALPGEAIHSCLTEELKEICEAIAKKLNNDPTAAVEVGQIISLKVADLLHSQDDLCRYLSAIAQKDWFDEKTKALMRSYHHLPGHLQRCFSYCSVFPKGYEFKALELVQLWMAQGFIKLDDRIEGDDVDNDYLEMLVSRFYIQSHDSYYTLHELLYNLAEKVSRSDCLRIEGNHQSEIPSTIRHLCIPANELNENKQEICKLKKLRTLIVTKGESATSEENVATDIFNRFKNMRVLVLQLDLENLAAFISEMKHLRYLRVSSARRFVLPECVCTLYQLQVLDVENTSTRKFVLPKCTVCGLYQLQVLEVENTRAPPENIKNLVDLRYLWPSVIPGFGTLLYLLVLERDVLRGRLRIANLENVESEGNRGYELEQLQSLHELRGRRLCIVNLENVESKESAIAANLNEKMHLHILQLVWRGSVNSNLDVEILEALQLPPNLTSLSFDGYRGQSWPSRRDYQTRNNIQELALRRCEMLEELPPMDQLYPSCISLELSHLSKLKALHALPPQLTMLIIENTPSLIFVTEEDLLMSPDEKKSIVEVMRKRMSKWFPHQYQMSLVKNERKMRNLIAATNGSNSNEAGSQEHNKSDRERWLEMHEQTMKLIYSRQNEAKLLLPSTLTRLWLEGCNITNRALSACLQTLTSLTCLSLVDIRTITCLPPAATFAQLQALQTLHLRDCWALTSLGGIRSLPRLEDLILIRCPYLDGETASLPSSLQSIHLESCADVDAILTNADLPCLSCLMITQCRMRTALLKLGNLGSLRCLIIEHCPGLSLLADVQKLRSLEYLILRNCSNLQAMMNLPWSLKSLGICKCPILEAQSVNIDPRSGMRMLGNPVEDSFEHAL